MPLHTANYPERVSPHPACTSCPLLQGQAGAKRASYEAKWQFFVGKHPEAPIAYKDVPWILPSEDAGHEELQRVVLYGEVAVCGMCQGGPAGRWEGSRWRMG